MIDTDIDKWLGARGGVIKLARGSLLFLSDPHQIWRRCIVEWSLLNNNVLDFRYVFGLSNWR